MKKEVCLFVKRVLSVVLCLLTILSFASCGLGEETTKENSIGMIVKSADDAIEQLKEAETKFGYENALSELTEKSTAVIDGDSYYRFQQNYEGIPVYGRTIVCATDENGKNVDLIGNLEDVSEDLKTTPSVSIEQIENTVSTYFIEELSFNSDFVVNLDYLTNDYLVVYTKTAADPTLSIPKKRWYNQDKMNVLQEVSYDRKKTQPNRQDRHFCGGPRHLLGPV